MRYKLFPSQTDLTHMNIYKHSLLLFTLLISTFVSAGQTQVAVASNFYEPMLQLATAFEKETGNKVLISAGATGALYAQIKNGAPFDVFFAADQRRPGALLKEGNAIKGSRFTYAQGRLALWSKQLGYNSEADFKKSLARLDHLAVANPKNAPYGAAAIDVLKKINVYQKIKTKIVEGQNIGQTYQYVSTQNVIAGFVSLSQVYRNGQIIEGSAWIIPSALHRPLNQDALLLLHGKNNKTAISFLAFLHSNAAQAIIRSFGYHI